MAVTVLTCGRAIEVATSRTPTRFAGWRAWFHCPECDARTSQLYVIDNGLACRRCAAIPYQSRKACGAAWWRSWGRAVHQLARARAELARDYLRRARRAELEQLEAQLTDKICRALAAEQAATLEWEAKSRRGAWFALPPFGLGYDWDHKTGEIVPIV